MEQLITDAKRLVHQLHSHDTAVDSLVGDATGLQGKLDSMKSFRAAVSQLNSIGNQKAKSTLVLGEQLENERIKQLEQENQELQVSLAEHQSALVLIMKKYREQVVALLKANGQEKKVFESFNNGIEDAEHMQEELAEIKSTVKAAVLADDETENQLMDLVHRLKCENETLRELLNISEASKATIKRKKHEKSLPTNEERRLKKALSLPSAPPAEMSPRKTLGKLRFNSPAFTHRDASDLLFPGLSPVEKEFSPKSLGAWIKSEEHTERKANDQNHMSNSPRKDTMKINRDEAIDETINDDDVEELQISITNPQNLSPDSRHHCQAVVFEDERAEHDSDTIVYDISYELSAIDDDIDEEETYQNERNEADDGEEEALANLNSVIDQFQPDSENEATD